MKTILRLFLLAVVGSMLVSCGSEKGAATTAITAAETAWAAAKDGVTKVMPDSAKSVEDAIAAAKVSLESGDAKAALASAQAIPGRIQELTAGLAAKEAELRGMWDTLSAGMPGVVESIQAQVDKLSRAKKLPAGIDQAALDGAKASLAEATAKWTEAQNAQASGNIAEAVTQASGVKDPLVQILGALKMPIPAALQA